jgi:HAD superfamily hydrolase (TIGR01549 family)
MRRLDTVLFDLDDTLHDDTACYRGAAEQVAQEIAAAHAIDALALKAAYVMEAESFWQRLSGDVLKTKLAPLREEMWRNALSSVGLDHPELPRYCADRYIRIRNERLELFPGAIDLLRALRERHVKLGLVTNGFSETHREKIELLRIGSLFDAIFIADEVGMVKPDPLLFAHACMQLESRPARSAMVGDRYERDIRGAHEAGLFTVWVNVHGAALPAGAPPPDATVETIGQVLSVLPLGGVSSSGR